MAKITRKQLLKGGMAGAAAAAALPFVGPMALASEGAEGVLVHAHGTVRLTEAVAGAGLPAGFPIDISVDATGRKGSTSGDLLSGAGWDNDTFDSPDVSGVCYFSQRGTLRDDSFHVRGVVFLSNTRDFLGARVTTDANLETGAITWTFGPGPLFPFTAVFRGTGVVVKVD